jgi:hypothetical protein
MRTRPGLSVRRIQGAQRPEVTQNMRAETQSVLEEIKQSVGLLRRHL